jgi:hypothetical protein
LLINPKKMKKNNIHEDEKRMLDLDGEEEKRKR